MGELRVVDASPYRLVLITAPAGAAVRLAEVLVRERLASCVNQLGPVRSTYWWRGNVETEEEVLLVIKTSVDLLTKMLGRVKELHPYETPEFIALPLREGSAEYLHWLANELSAQQGDATCF